MHVDIYKSNNSPKYLVVLHERNISQLPISDVDITEVSTFKKDLEIDLNRPRIGFDQKAAIAAIAINGYYIQ